MLLPVSEGQGRWKARCLTYVLRRDRMLLAEVTASPVWADAARPIRFPLDKSNSGVIMDLKDIESVSGTALSRREFLTIAAAGTAAGVMELAGCGGKPGEANSITIALDRGVNTLDPAMHRSRTTEAVIRNIFDGLVTRDQDMKVVPELAESWRTIDEHNWEFKLRENVRFHDGSAFTAEDVKFTIDRIITRGAVGGESSPRKGLLGDVDGSEILDEHTVVLHTAKPFPALPAMLTFHEIVPKGYIEKVGDGHFATNPVGAGPFRFKLWKRGERVLLERFDDYYGGSPDIPPVGQAKLDSVRFKPIPESASRISALLAGEVHVIEKVPPHSVKTVRTARTGVGTAESTRTHYLGLNVVSGPFRDIRARQAVSHAVDFQAIVEKVLSGYATVLAGPLVPAALGFDAQLRPVRHDPQHAKYLLRRANFPMDFQIEIDTEDSDKEIAQVLADQLRAAGLKARARVWNWDLLQPQLIKRKRTAFVTHWGNASLDPIGILEPLFSSDGRGNFTGFADSEVDDALAKARSMFDKADRERAYVRVQRIIRQQLAGIFGLARNEIYGVSKRVHDWKPKPDGMLNMHDVSLG